MSLIINKTVGRDITIDKYYIAVELPSDGIQGKQYQVEYIRHNGYTKIHAFIPDKDSFGEWLNTFNTRFQRNKQVNWQRKKKVTDWAFKTIEQAYATYLTEAPEARDE